ncbi:MAG: hypothetical protein LC674_01985, partial [Actinobacteria bacterium]|nr:hypothetical protein [Actinomycetota bacterium]
MGKLEEENRAYKKLKDELQAQLQDRTTELWENDSEISELKRRLDNAEMVLLDKDRKLSVVNSK